MRIIELIADRRIREAQAEGYFDDLAMHGQPIPDLDRHRESGWWAKRTVERHRDTDKADDLRAHIKATLTAAWRLEREAEVRTVVAALNERIATYNRWTTVEQLDPLDPADIARRWRELRTYFRDRRAAG
ncbi:MAG: DnaJ family domain-containing protein [Actinomycetota bacterium]|nr:DnaJ family domain-containing protein [Actinomycetota bacterium]